MTMFAAFKEIYAFFFRQDLKSRRTKIFFLLSLLPVLVLLVTKIAEMANPAGNISAERIFSQVLLTIYIQLLIPVLALLFGSMVVNDEVDQKTLVFLTTTPIPKPAVVLGKYAAYATLSSIIISIGLLLSFIIINLNRFGNMAHVKSFFSFTAVGLLALVTYMAFFTLLGTVMKKSILLGLLFIFGWENIVQYFPGSTQKFTLIHYIKSMLPYSDDGGGFLRFLMKRLEPSSTVESVTVLVIILVVALALASYVFKNKEYILSDSV
ncbi:MAG: ABC transporter permease subunit [bacterium]|nr:ABC transporter permease subunit [bacterium]